MDLSEISARYERRSARRRREDAVRVYQQVESHVLLPVVYGRAVDLSPLGVLVAITIGAELAGVLGALAAIRVAVPSP
ncbi:MAG: AI-2E family transporter [Gaiellaceae bacterium]